MLEDRTARVEQEVSREQTPALRHLLKLFAFGFSSTKLISTIYLGAFLLLSLLRPVLAFLWGRYIQEAESEESVWAAVALLVGYFLIQFFIDLLTRYVYLYDDIEQINLVQSNRQKEKLYTKLYRKLAEISPEYFEVPKINDRVEQVFQFLTARYGGMNTSIMLQSYVMIAKAVSVASIAVSLYLFDPWLCLIVLLAPLPTIWTRTVGQKLQFAFFKNNTKLLRRADYFQKLMMSPASKEMKTLGLYDFFYGKWKGAADTYTVKEAELVGAQTKFLLLNALMISLTTVTGTVIAILRMVSGKLSLGALGAVISLVSTLVADVKEMLTAAATFQMKKNEAAQFFDLMDLDAQRKAGAAPRSIERLEMKDVGYRYPLTDRYALEGANLTIRSGEKVAFVGENGAGKTTAVKMICGMLFPSSGSLTIDGVQTEDIDPAVRPRLFSAVSQNPPQYTTFTVGENVFLGDTAADKDELEIRQALAFAGLEELPEDQLLGKDVGGSELSGGQWQKLAIARAAYHSRGWVVLDEPTSNLDPLAENEIFQKYLALAENKTVIFVTHRISVAALADRIVVFSGGKIVQDGTHQELMAQGGEYARLYQEQAKWYDR